jgi:hypothetical protein
VLFCAVFVHFCAISAPFLTVFAPDSTPSPASFHSRENSFVRNLILLAWLALAAASAREISIHVSGPRALRRAVWQLQRQTGWAISVEEPLWQPVA